MANDKKSTMFCWINKRIVAQFVEGYSKKYPT